LLFQYPEHQLFEETVFLDIAFGPRRMGLTASVVEERVRKAARIVGLRDEDLDRSPFELSGGQKRRAAIAGVLAMEPEVLILDEPAAGLDPAGRDEILSYAEELRDLGVTVILVSHSMEDIARLADRVLVLRQGRVHSLGRPAEVFADETALAEAGLAVPRPAAFLRAMREWLPELDCDCYSPAAAARALILAAWRQIAPLQSGPDGKAGASDAR
jgi:energy-coupling factor transport system ATP-binding protein